jgi:hypothetical protein
MQEGPIYEYSFKQNKLIVVETIVGSIYTTQTTYFMEDSEIDERRKKFNSDVTIEQMLEQENILATSGDDYKELCNYQNKTYYYRDNANLWDVVIKDNNILEIKKTDIVTKEITEIKYFDFTKKEIYTNNRDLDVPDNYQFIVALAETIKTLNTKKKRNFMNALVDCEYYGKHYLPENISIGDTNSPKWKTFLFAISSLMISYQRIDAEENLNPEHVNEIRKAFSKYNSGLFRSTKHLVRGIITAPTVPLIIPYYLLVVYALNRWASNGN